MRFSMRWMFAVTAYVALLAAAVGVRNQVLVDVVWGVTIIAIGYALVVAVVDRGKRQAMGVGFVALAAAHVICMYLAPTSLPAVRLLEAAGYGVNVGAGTTFWVELSAPNQLTRGSGAVLPASRLVPDFRMMNGVVTLVAGMVGYAVGTLAIEESSGGELTNRLLRPAGAAEWQSCPVRRHDGVVDFRFVRVEPEILHFHAARGAIDRQADRIDRWDGGNLTTGGGFWPFVLDPAIASNRGNAAAIFTGDRFRHHDEPRNSAGPT